MSEALAFLEWSALRLSPVYSGSTIPQGDGSAVVLIPGLLELELTVFELHSWLDRIGYRPYYSGLGVVADCPNLLSGQLDATIDRAYAETGREVHLIGHSLGGIFARSAAVRRPGRIASVIVLGTPFRGLVMHRLVIALGDAVRGWIHLRHPDLPKECGTSRCPCPFGRSLRRPWPRSVAQTVIYTKSDGLVDWRYCRTGDPDIDIEVVGTHLGLPYNTHVYRHIGFRLAAAKGRRRPVTSRRTSRAA